MFVRIDQTYTLASSFSVSFSSYKSFHLSSFLPVDLSSSFHISNCSSFSFSTCPFDLKPLPNHCRIPKSSVSIRIQQFCSSNILCTQYGHRICALFSLPHALHLFNAVTSFNALPAICRCRFFIWLVFFFGTAFNNPSHSSPSNVGVGANAAGMRLAFNRSWGICWTNGNRCIASSCGRSRARTTGRNASRKEADGTRRDAIAVDAERYVQAYSTQMMLRFACVDLEALPAKTRSFPCKLRLLPRVMIGHP